MGLMMRNVNGVNIAVMDQQAIRDYFARTPRLSELCTQNGWPDPDTLTIEVIGRDGDAVLCSVSFDEVIMEGAGCVAGRIGCWGQYKVRVAADGAVESEFLVGSGVP